MIRFDGIGFDTRITNNKRRGDEVNSEGSSLARLTDICISSKCLHTTWFGHQEVATMIVHLILIILFCHIEIGLVASQTQKDADGRSVHLVAYSNKIIEESCMSMEIAILNGWTYNLLTKVDQRRDSNISDTNNSSPYVVVTPQFNKLFAFHNVLRFLPADDLVLLVDAYDVIIQGNYKKFLKTVYDTKNLFWDHRQSLLYNAEGNCHPFNVVNEM